MKVPATKHRPPPAPTLGRFVTLPENRAALLAVRRLAAHESKREGRRSSFPLLFLHGPPGTGKSHLVQGLVARIAGTAARTANVVPARDLGRLLTELPAPGAGPAREGRDADLLVVEDVQHLPAHAADALAGLIDDRQARRAATVVTGASGPAALRQFPARLTSRLAGGLVVGLEPLAPASRRELAGVLCERRGLRVTGEVLDWLARRPTGGARPILGDLARLEQLARRLPPPLGLAAVATELGDGDEEAPAVERVAEKVAGHFGLKPKQLRGRGRRHDLLWPRQVAMYLARRLTGLSLARVGAAFGGYDHSTVLHACRKVEEALAGDPGLAGALRELASGAA
jgi:chromosomal replication initiator protein